MAASPRNWGLIAGRRFGVAVGIGPGKFTYRYEMSNHTSEFRSGKPCVQMEGCRLDSENLRSAWFEFEGDRLLARGQILAEMPANAVCVASSMHLRLVGLTKRSVRRPHDLRLRTQTPRGSGTPTRLPPFLVDISACCWSRQDMFIVWRCAAPATVESIRKILSPSMRRTVLSAQWHGLLSYGI